MPRALNLLGERFCRLLVVEKLSNRTVAGKVQWKCLCDCGNIVITTGSHLVDGHTKSCSCLQKDIAKTISHTTHGRTKTPEYYVWQAMKSRCVNSKNVSYKDYGGRGITVCERWMQSFECFLHDMGERPSEHYSLERRDTNGNYEPSNCKWATTIEQENNKRTNRIVEYKGERLTLAQLARKTNLRYGLIHSRIVRQKWSVAKAVTASV